MKSSLLFDFTVDKSTCTVFIDREFDAERALVWDAFTKPEILDQWWAPKPMRSETKYMNFKAGGRRFYAMVGPDGQAHWGVQDFTAVSPKTNFKFVSAFTDADENINKDLSSSAWSLDFSETGGVTKVNISIKLNTLADMERRLQMGFKEGFTMTLNDLEERLHTLNKKAK